MDKKEAIRKLRAYLSCEGLAAMVVPSNDPHFGEYIPDHYKCREWLSCFNGSAGTLVVTSQKAALWTDSRYFVQAEQQLEGTDISLMKLSGLMMVSSSSNSSIDNELSARPSTLII